VISNLNINLRQCLVLGLGFLAYFLTHCLFLDQVPGIHFDEAWAANFAHRLSTGQLGIPIEAMSPYTVPWSHAVTALFFKLFHTSLFVDRLSGIFLSALGVFLACCALLHENKPQAASILPWICAFFLPLVLNHRFCIEITTFQVFCFGLLLYGLSRDLCSLTGLAIFMGITSHILFIAPVLALWIVRRLNPLALTRREKTLVVGVCVSLIPFLVRVLIRIPEREKSVALLVLTFAILFDVFAPQIGNFIFWKSKKIILFVTGLLGIPSLLFLLFFSEGHWNVLFNHGWIAYPQWIGWSWFILLGATLYGGWTFYRKNKEICWSREFLTWMLFCVVLTTLVATKPTSRYYEAGFLGMALMASLALAHVPLKQALSLLSIFAILSSIQLWKNYYQVGLNQMGQERSFSFYIPRDNSSDFLPKQDLVRYLAKQGCRIQNVQSADSRMMEALQFLTHGDWPVSPETPCKLGQVWVNRKSQAATPLPSTTRIAEVGTFAVDQILDPSPL
jgi:hypothetical protein